MMKGYTGIKQLVFLFLICVQLLMSGCSPNNVKTDDTLKTFSMRIK